MSIISDAIQAKCLAFGDRVIKLNDYLLKEAANAKPAYKIVKGKRVYENASMRRVYQCICNPCQISAISYFGQEPALEPIMPRHVTALVKLISKANLLLH